MYYIVEHKELESVLSVIQLFCFGEKTTQTDVILGDKIVLKSYINDNEAICEIYESKDKIVSFKQSINNLEDTLFITETKRAIKLTVFYALKKIRNLNMPWGILTGIRPTKKINELMGNGTSESKIRSILKEKYLATDEKIELAIKIANAEKHILADNNKNKISIYIGIPFCPTRCIYCSFPSFNLSTYKEKVDLYLDALEKEILYIKDYMKNLEIESIYIGGGTPTAINESQFYRLLEMIDKNFEKPTMEYTIEAGRSDTITRQKLKFIKQFGATRISINPQTLNDKTLQKIGRNHSESDFLNAFNLAREEELNNINTDIILGLTDEVAEDVEYTLKGLSKLKPESLTVHTLAIKRPARLKEELHNFNATPFYEMEKMLNTTKYYAEYMKMEAYYMYRQKNTIGNFENVGYCIKGLESVYNIQIMEEKQTIISFGAGATSKFYFEENNLIKRAFNVKDVGTYINRIYDMINRKIEILEEGF